MSDYNYKKHIETPQQKGVSDGSWLKDLLDDVPINIDYLNLLLKGPALGNKYTIESGYCKNGSKRKIIIDNIPRGQIHIPGVPAAAFGNTNLRGLIPGTLAGMWQINPANLYSNMKGEGPNVMDCFENKSKNKSKKKNIILNITIIILIILLVILILRDKNYI